MPVEIEKKFLVKSDEYKNGATSKILMQGYLCSGAGPTVRIRIAGDEAFITIKGKHQGISRLEYEYPIPVDDARSLLEDICLQPIIHKQRYIKNYRGFTWEIDEFYGDNEGLVLAEIELTSEEQEFDLPPWIGKEVTHDGRYYNASLRSNPFKDWRDSQQ